LCEFRIIRRDDMILNNSEKTIYKRLMNMGDEEAIEFSEYLEDLEKMENLEDLHESASGSIKFAIGKGLEELSERQWEVISRGLAEYYYIHECELCTERIEWNEMHTAIDTKKCSRCNYMIEKENINL